MTRNSETVIIVLITDYERRDVMNWSVKRSCSIVLALILIITAVFPLMRLQVSADGSNEIALPHGYFTGAETDPPFVFEGQLGYNFTYDSYPKDEVNAYIKYLEGFGLEAEPTAKQLNGMQTRSVEYQGQLCVKINYRPTEKTLTILLFQDMLERLGFRIAAAQPQPNDMAVDGPWNLEEFFGTASQVVSEENRTRYSFNCNGYPQDQIDDYCAALEIFGLEKGSIIGMFGPSRTRRYNLNGELAVQIGWLNREKRLNVYLYDEVLAPLKEQADASASATETVPQTTEPADVQTGATPTVAAGMCKVCGLDLGNYDGYCYYCHPDFLFTCVICGIEQPYHRPPDGVCDSCAAMYGNVDSVTGATG